jgi:hypothetical protein
MAFNATCPYPFAAEKNFPKLGGGEFLLGEWDPGDIISLYTDTNARLCFPLPLWQTECCLPCPRQDYFYRDSRFNIPYPFPRWAFESDYPVLYRLQDVNSCNDLC